MKLANLVRDRLPLPPDPNSNICPKFKRRILAIIDIYSHAPMNNTKSNLLIFDWLNYNINNTYYISLVGLPVFSTFINMNSSHIAYLYLGNQ